MDPHVWTLIGVLATLMFAMHRLTVREMTARFEAVDARFDAVDVRFDAVESVMAAKFETVDHRLAALETDMAIVKGSLVKQRTP